MSSKKKKITILLKLLPVPVLAAKLSTSTGKEKKFHMSLTEPYFRELLLGLEARS
jgi:hypothetical protein